MLLQASLMIGTVMSCCGAALWTVCGLNSLWLTATDMACLGVTACAAGLRLAPETYTSDPYACYGASSRGVHGVARLISCKLLRQQVIECKKKYAGISWLKGVRVPVHMRYDHVPSNSQRMRVTRSLLWSRLPCILSTWTVMPTTWHSQL